MSFVSKIGSKVLLKANVVTFVALICLIERSISLDRLSKVFKLVLKILSQL